MRQKFIKGSISILVLLGLLLAALLGSLMAGDIDISFTDLPQILSSKQGLAYTVLTKIRLPRAILGFAVGGALSLSGAMLQGVFRNPLVEPYTLGISGGAALGVAFCIVFGLHLSLGSMALPLMGFAGAVLCIFLVYGLSNKSFHSMNRMLLIGVMISFVSSSIMMFLMATTTSENLHSIIFWIMGSLDEPNITLVYTVLVMSLLGLVLSYLFARPLNALRLGHEKAKHLGIHTERTVKLLFLLASLLTGVCVAVAGVVGFVGLVIPHLVRQLVGSDFRVFLAGSFIGGSAFLLVCDVVARTIIAPNELPIGVITGMAGGAVFIVVLSQGNKAKI